MIAMEKVDITLSGLHGDRHPSPGKRAVTLLQAEHLPVVAALANVEVTADMLRRNLLVEGINLTSLRGRSLAVGGAVLQVTGPCAPCSRMEDILGPGGYNAMRGHGGVTAQVTSAGSVSVGDPVTVING